VAADAEVEISRDHPPGCCRSVFVCNFERSLMPAWLVHPASSLANRMMHSERIFKIRVIPAARTFFEE
jgi:hypothetical protein